MSKAKLIIAAKRLTNKEFKLPNAPTLKSRKSTIAKALSDGISPRLRPTEHEYKEFLEFFPKVNGNQLCAYCTKNASYFEHFRPLVWKGKPTGYGSDIYNLVPSCNYCNEIKGNDRWEDHMLWLKKEEQLNNVEYKNHFKTLQEFEAWGGGKVLKISYEELIGKTKWKKYLDDYNNLCKTLDKMSVLQKEIREAVNEEVKKMPNN